MYLLSNEAVGKHFNKAFISMLAHIRPEVGKGVYAYFNFKKECVVFEYEDKLPDFVCKSVEYCGHKDGSRPEFVLLSEALATCECGATYEDLVKIMRDRIIKTALNKGYQGVNRPRIHVIYKIKDGYAYYFNEECVWSKVLIERIPEGIFKWSKLCSDIDSIENLESCVFPKKNVKSVRAIFEEAEEGDTLEHLTDRIVSIECYEDRQGVDRYSVPWSEWCWRYAITNLYEVILHREKVGKHSEQLVKVEVLLFRTDFFMSISNQVVRKYASKFYKIALRQIERDEDFREYCIPVSKLVYTKMSLAKRYIKVEFSVPTREECSLENRKDYIGSILPLYFGEK